jgi:hypothetical protein
MSPSNSAWWCLREVEVEKCESKSQWNTGCNLQPWSNNTLYHVTPTIAITLIRTIFLSLKCLHFGEQVCKPRVERYTRSPTWNIGGDRIDLAANLSFESIKSCFTTFIISTMLMNLSATSAVDPTKGNNLSVGVEG